MSKTNIVLLTYGSRAEHYRAVFCALSFFSHHKGDPSEFRLNVYTDAIGFFKAYLFDVDVEYTELTDQVLNNMLGGTHYIHRRKVEVIDQTFKKYPNENLLFVDSDTFFLTDPALILSKISESTSVMHVKEYKFEEGLRLFASFNQSKEPEAFIRFIESGPLEIAGKWEKIDRTDVCWNSGILGLSHVFSPYLKDVFNLTDKFFENSSWFISEQLAFSIVLSRVSSITGSSSEVVHYWGKRQKVLMDEKLAALLEPLASKIIKSSLIRNATRRLKHNIIEDKHKEQALIALSQGSLKYGIKQTVLAMLENPKNILLLKTLFNRKLS